MYAANCHQHPLPKCIEVSNVIPFMQKHHMQFFIAHILIGRQQNYRANNTIGKGCRNLLTSTNLIFAAKLMGLHPVSHKGSFHRQRSIVYCAAAPVCRCDCSKAYHCAAKPQHYSIIGKCRRCELRLRHCLCFIQHRWQYGRLYHWPIAMGNRQHLIHTKGRRNGYRQQQSKPCQCPKCQKAAGRKPVTEQLAQQYCQHNQHRPHGTHL